MDTPGVPMQNAGTRSLFVVIAILIGVNGALCAAFLTWRDGKSPYKAIILDSPPSLRPFSWPSPSSRRLGISSNRLPLILLHLGAVEVQVGTRRRRTALVLVPGAVDRRAVRVLGGRTRAEQAELADLHPRPELDGQRRHVGQLKRHVPGEPGIDPAGRRMRQQAEPAEAGVVCWDESRSGKEEACRVADLDAPDRAWLTLAYVDNRAETMRRPLLETGGLPLQPEHL